MPSKQFNWKSFLIALATFAVSFLADNLAGTHFAEKYPTVVTAIVFVAGLITNTKKQSPPSDDKPSGE